MATVQLQSVLFNNQKKALFKALDSLENAANTSKKLEGKLTRLTVSYGDASPTPVFSHEEVEQITKKYASAFDFNYTYFNENTGSAKGHNRLGEKCASDYMVIMNPDVVVCPRVFEIMLAPFFDEEKNAGMTEARQTPIEHPKEYNKKTYETDWATTACAMFSTETFRQINGFDNETFFLYCDDLDFSWRVRLLGKKIYYCPDAVVYHAKNLSASGKWTPTSAEVYFSAEASLLMAYKWSNNPRVKKLYNIFASSGDANLKKAAQHFDELKNAGKLPRQLDPEHKVAKFVGDYYTEHRFNL